MLQSEGFFQWQITDSAVGGQAPPAAVLARVAARRMLRLGVGGRLETAQGVSGQIVQSGIAMQFQVREKLLSHAARPETLDVICDADRTDKPR